MPAKAATLSGLWARLAQFKKPPPERRPMPPAHPNGIDARFAPARYLAKGKLAGRLSVRSSSPDSARHAIRRIQADNVLSLFQGYVRSIPLFRLHRWLRRAAIPSFCRSRANPTAKPRCKKRSVKRRASNRQIEAERGTEATRRIEKPADVLGCASAGLPGYHGGQIP